MSKKIETDKRISDFDYRLYHHIDAFLDGTEMKLYPGDNFLAAYFQKHPRTVRNALRRLRDYDYIRLGGRGKKLSVRLINQ